MDSRLEFAVKSAQEAANIALSYFGADFRVEEKEDSSPVTIADRRAEEHLRKLIQSAYPEDAIFGEEFGEDGTGTGRWLIDPIDGTKSFICNVPLFGTLLSFEREGVPEIGVAVFPALELWIYAAKGQGAQSNAGRAMVSKTSNLSEAVISCGSISSLDKTGRLADLTKLSHQIRAVRGWSDAYGHFLVATGRIEAMVDPIIKRYDISAMEVIVQEAGGKCTDFSGNHSPQIEALSSNGALHEKLSACFVQGVN